MLEPALLNEQELGQDPDSVLTVIGKLGKGSYGSVYKALHKRTGRTVALKIVPIANDLDAIIKEINVLNSCDSPSIVRYFGSYFKNNSLWAGSVSDIMKVCQCVMAEKEIAWICQAAVDALIYLHDRRKIHRDIKAGNILITLDGTAKLADFGVAGQLTDAAAKRNTVIGTPFWMAPEIIQEVGYGTAADIWSLGITCLEMAQGKPPYHDIHPMRAIFLIPSRPSPALSDPGQYSPEFSRFIARCLVKQPAERPSAKALMEDAFLRGTSGDGTLVARNPPPSLVEKAQLAVERIAQGALQEDLDGDAGSERSAESESNSGSMQPSPTTGTMRKHAGPGTTWTATMKPKATAVEPQSSAAIKSTSEVSLSDSIQEAFDTFVIHAADEDPLTTGGGGGGGAAAAQEETKLQTMRPTGNSNVIRNQAQSNRKDRGMEMPTTSEPLLQSSPSELAEMLQQLDRNMELEILMIKAKYERKRVPILEAARQK